VRAKLQTPPRAGLIMEETPAEIGEISRKPYRFFKWLISSNLQNEFLKRDEGLTLSIQNGPKIDALGPF
jgi:hypothetical protein